MRNDGRNQIQLTKALDLLCRPGGATYDELAERLEISKRQAIRYRDILDKLGIPVGDLPSEDRKKRFGVMEHYVKKIGNLKIPNLDLNLSEIIALHLIKGEAKTYKGTDIEKTINTAFSKLEMFMPKGLSEKLDAIKTLFIPVSKFAKDYSGKEKIIEDITEAMLQRRTCRARYHSFSDDRIKEFCIDPLRFFEYDGGLYIYARVTRFDRVLAFAVERIKSFELTYDLFRYPEDFDPDETLGSAFGIISDEPIEAKIWFSADQARYIKERVWAKGQRITKHKDGSIILHIKTSGWWDVKKWVLSYGKEAKVIKPEELRKQIYDELAAASRHYGYS